MTATDGELEAHTDIRVNLKDANDNAPFFPSHITTATVSEDTPLGSPHAKQPWLMTKKKYTDRFVVLLSVLMLLIKIILKTLLI